MKKRKNKILPLVVACSLMAVSGAVVYAYTEYESPYEAKAVEYTDNAYSVTLSVNELNNYHFDNFFDFIQDNYSITLQYDYYVAGETSTFVITNNDGDYDYYFMYNSFSTYYIWFGYDNINHEQSKRFYLTSGSETQENVSYEYSLTLIGASSYYDDMKSAIDADIAANQVNPSQPLLDFISILVGGIQSMALGIARGIGSMATSLFLVVDGTGAITGLSTFGGILAIFCGLGLAIAITTKVYLWITSLGSN